MIVITIIKAGQSKHSNKIVSKEEFFGDFAVQQKVKCIYLNISMKQLERKREEKVPEFLKV